MPNEKTKTTKTAKKSKPAPKIAELVNQNDAFCVSVSLPAPIVSQLHDEAEQIGLTPAQFVSVLLHLYQNRE